MHIVKSVGVLSVARIMGLIYGCMGLLFAPFFLLVGLIGSMVGQQKTPFAGIFGVVFAIFMPVLYGGLGFIMGAIGGLLYNLFARWVGGFELELGVRSSDVRPIEVRPTMVTAPYPLIPPANPGS